MSAVELVTATDDGTATTTSLIVADGTANDHASVLRLIRDNLADFEEFDPAGLVRFEIRPRPQGQHGGGDVQYAVLNEEQATLLLTYMRNSDVVRDFKKRLVRAFYELRRGARLALPDISTPEGVAVMAAMFNDTAQKLVVVTNEKKCLEAAIERDAHLVAKAEAHTASTSAVHRQAFAREVQAWGIKTGHTITHEQVYAFLRHKGMLIGGQRSDRNHATAEAVKHGWAFTHKDVTDTGHPYATTYLNPRGQDIAWKWITAFIAANGSLALPRQIGGVA